MLIHKRSSCFEKSGGRDFMTNTQKPKPKYSPRAAFRENNDVFVASTGTTPTETENSTDTPSAVATVHSHQGIADHHVGLVPVVHKRATKQFARCPLGSKPEHSVPPPFGDRRCAPRHHATRLRGLVELAISRQMLHVSRACKASMWYWKHPIGSCDTKATRAKRQGAASATHTTNLSQAGP